MNKNKNEVTFIRMVGAPKDKVFNAWADQNLLKQWWGPRGFENSVCEIEAKVGGKINIVMEGGEKMGPMKGIKFPMEGSFTEVSFPDKLSFKSFAYFPGNKEPQIEQMVTVMFEDFQGITKMTVDVKIINATPSAAGALDGMEQGWSESFYKLAELLDA